MPGQWTDGRGPDHEINLFEKYGYFNTAIWRGASWAAKIADIYVRDGGLETCGQDCSRGFHVNSQYDAESENVAMITGIASDACGVQGGAQCGFEMKYFSPETLILNMDMHENLYLLTAPSIFLLLGASDNEMLSKMLSTGAERCGL